MGKVVSVNTTNLKIARENVGMDVYRASKSVSQSKKDCVFLWETGKELPTWAQIKKLSKLYNIPELVLLSKNNIQKNKDVPDFRVGVSEEEKDEVKKLIDFVLKRQKWLEDFFKKEGYKKNKLLGSGEHINSPIKLADFISERLKIDIKEIKNISGLDAPRKVLKYLINKAEEHGIFVGKTISYHRIPVEHMRGIFISNDFCPFIVLNRQDAICAQIFSFIHELAHFFRKSDSISNSIDFRSSNKDLNKEEVICNRVAANLLLPENDFTQSFYNIDDIKRISEQYKASELFVFYRLKELGKINPRFCDEWENDLKSRSKKNVEDKKNTKKSGGNYYNNMIDSNGELFNRIIVGSYFEKKINFVEASNLLKFSVEIYEY